MMNVNEIKPKQSSLQSGFRLALMIIYVAFCPALNAQETRCEELTENIEKLMRDASPEDLKWIKKELSETLCSPWVSDGHIMTIEETLIEFQKKRLTASNGLVDYFKAIDWLLNHPEVQKWDAWHTSLIALINGRKERGFEEFLMISHELFESNVLHQEGKFQWSLSDDSWVFETGSFPPAIAFTSISLRAQNGMDTLWIQDVSGRWELDGTTCSISASRVPWKGTTWNPLSNFALLPPMELDLSDNGCRVDEAIMQTELAPEPLFGSFSVRLEEAISPETKTYPRFRCQEKSIQIERVYPETNFRGGLQIRGSEIVGISNDLGRAKIEVMQADTMFMEFEAAEFLFNSRGWFSGHSSISIHFRGDTVRHPDCTVRYDENSRKILVNRQTEGLGQQAFMDTYHQLEWDVEGLSWTIGGPQIKIGSASGDRSKPAVFKSSNYFEKQAFDALQGPDPINPVVELYRYIQTSGRMSFTSEDFAQYIQMGEMQSRLQLMRLANQGYVTFDPEALWCDVLPKTIDHIRYATGRKDYDVIEFYSAPAMGFNAEWSLNNGFLAIQGIESLRLSSARDVEIRPEEGVIQIEKNKDFNFNGRIKAGNIEMEGRNMRFDYTAFSMDFRKIEHVRFWVQDETDLDYRGMPRKKQVKSSLEMVSGTLAIDHPTNKSGVRANLHKNFPVFRSVENSFVHFDSPLLYDGAYKRDRFYYAVEPFELKNLDKLNVQNLVLPGTLVSAGILEDIKEPLRVMDDQHFGFQTRTPVNGSPIYQGSAQFDQEVTLDGQGLHGSGIIDFLSAHVVGEHFVMLPDSLIGVAASMENVNSPSADVASAFGEKGEIVFKPGIRQLTMRSNASPFDMYDGQSQLSGSLYLSDNGLFGAGLFDLYKADLTSEEFVFHETKALSNSAKFNLNGNRGGIAAFQTDDVIARLDFENRMGDFTPNSGETKIELPIQQYICFMDRFRWFMDEDEIDLMSDRNMGELPLDFSENRSVSNFISAHPDQDSLHFLSTSATYRIQDDYLKCRGVNEIAVADARIAPDSGLIIIQPKARIEVLKNAQLVANATTQHHVIKQASISIGGKYKFEGSGFYEYEDVQGQKSEIFLNHIFVDETIQTRGTGSLTAKNRFELSPAFYFAGQVEMESADPLLYFNGATKMILECENYPLAWIKFEGRIDPLSVAIPLQGGLFDTDGDQLAAGMMASARPPFIMYPSFLNLLGEESDNPILAHEGELRFDQGRYIISTLEKFENPASIGNRIELTPNICELSGTGTINMPLTFGLADQEFVGSFFTDNRGNYHIKGSLKLYFHFNSDLFERMALQIPSWRDATPIQVSSTNYEEAIRTWLGEEPSEKLINDLVMNGSFKNIPKKLQESVVITGLDLIWDPNEESFISNGRMGIVSLGKASVFQQIQGKLELKRSRSGDSFVLYLHGDEENWYYFEFKLNKLNVTTSDMTFYEILADIKADKRKIKDKEGNSYLFQYMSSSKRRDNLVDTYRDFE